MWHTGQHRRNKIYPPYPKTKKNERLPFHCGCSESTPTTYQPSVTYVVRRKEWWTIVDDTLSPTGRILLILLPRHQNSLALDTKRVSSRTKHSLDKRAPKTRTNTLGRNCVQALTTQYLLESEQKKQHPRYATSVCYSNEVRMHPSPSRHRRKEKVTAACATTLCALCPCVPRCLAKPRPVSWRGLGSAVPVVVNRNAARLSLPFLTVKRDGR